MILHKVLTCQYAESSQHSDCLLLSIDATIEGEHAEFTYIYRSDDPYGLAPTIKAWLADHPDLPIGPYVESVPDPQEGN